MKTYLVTGGAGFIGSNFVKHALLDEDVQVLCMDKLTYAGNIDNLREELKSKRLKFIRRDINDIDALKWAFSKWDVDKVINFAAESHVDRSIDDPQIFLKTNVLGTQSLLKAARKYWETSDGYKEGKRFVHISTDEVYGSIKKGKFSEKSQLDSHSPYAASKAAADLIVKAYVDTYKFPAVITRCSNNYGPYQFPEKIIPLMLSNMLSGKELPVYGKGQNVRDWIHVMDHCRAVDMVMAKGRVGEVYNIGADCERKNIDLVKLLMRKLGLMLEEEPKYKKLLKSGRISSKIAFVKDRPGHDFRYAMDSRKIRKLGWKPEIKFDDGIRLTIKWYLDNIAWLKNVISGDYQRYYEKMYSNR